MIFTARPSLFRPDNSPNNPRPRWSRRWAKRPSWPPSLSVRRAGTDYFPLQVVYEEKYYAAGKIKSSRFVKREGKPSDQAVLTGRMIDRSLRSLFDADLRNDIQVIVTVLSLDEVHPPDVLGVLTASAALSLCGLGEYFQGPVSAVRVASRGGQSREELLRRTIERVERAEDYEEVAAPIEVLCQAYNLQRAEDKQAFKGLFDALQRAHPEWTERLKKCYEASKQWSESERREYFRAQARTVVNPDYTQAAELDLDLVVSGNGPSIMMIEASGKIVSEEQIGSGLDTAVAELATLTKFQQKFVNKVLSEREVVLPELITVTPDEKYTHYWRQFVPGLTKAMYAAGDQTRERTGFARLQRNPPRQLRRSPGPPQNGQNREYRATPKPNFPLPNREGQSPHERTGVEFRPRYFPGPNPSLRLPRPRQ